MLKETEILACFGNTTNIASSEKYVFLLTYSIILNITDILNRLFCIVQYRQIPIHSKTQLLQS